MSRERRVGNEAGRRARDGRDRLRALNVPRRAVVELDERGLPVAVAEAGGTAAATSSPARARPRPSQPARRMVEAIGEVWRVDDEWWRAPISRRYVEVMLEGGKHAMLFEDLVTQEWFIQDI